MTPDVNVLLAASRRDHPHHGIALQWLEQALANAAHAPLVLQPMVVASFLRLATHPKIFSVPTPIEHALAFIDALLDAPGAGLASLDGEWPVLSRLCREHGLLGNDLPDAWLAAAVLRQGEHLASFDGDFRRLLSRSQLTHLKP